MALDITKSVEIIELMGNFIEFIRPEPAIRNQLDYSYEIQEQSVILNETRPGLLNPDKMRTRAFAKATFMHKKNIWKVYWKRANGEWISYTPQPEVAEQNDFLILIDEDEHKCFKG